MVLERLQAVVLGTPVIRHLHANPSWLHLDLGPSKQVGEFEQLGHRHLGVGADIGMGGGTSKLTAGLSRIVRLSHRTNLHHSTEVCMLLHAAHAHKIKAISGLRGLVKGAMKARQRHAVWHIAFSHHLRSTLTVMHRHARLLVLWRQLRRRRLGKLAFAWRLALVGVRNRRNDVRADLMSWNKLYRNNIFSRVWDRAWGTKIRVAWSRWTALSTGFSRRIDQCSQICAHFVKKKMFRLMRVERLAVQLVRSRGLSSGFALWTSHTVKRHGTERTTEIAARHWGRQCIVYFSGSAMNSATQRLGLQVGAFFNARRVLSKGFLRLFADAHKNMRSQSGSAVGRMKERLLENIESAIGRYRDRKRHVRYINFHREISLDTQRRVAASRLLKVRSRSKDSFISSFHRLNCSCGCLVFFGTFSLTMLIMHTITQQAFDIGAEDETAAQQRHLPSHSRNLYPYHSNRITPHPNIHQHHHSPQSNIHQHHHSLSINTRSRSTSPSKAVLVHVRHQSRSDTASPVERATRGNTSAHRDTERRRSRRQEEEQEEEQECIDDTGHAVSRGTGRIVVKADDSRIKNKKFFWRRWKRIHRMRWVTNKQSLYCDQSIYVCTCCCCSCCCCCCCCCYCCCCCCSLCAHFFCFVLCV